MPSVHFDSVTFAYNTARNILAGVDLHVGPGWTGVVGANGEGKSTLLRLVSGDLEPDEGSVTRDAALIVTCEQTVREPDDAVVAFAESWDPPAFAMRGRLDIEPSDIDRWDSLSPGERRRWQVGAALLSEPDVLLLDEPTNHLDSETREALLDVLERFAGLGLVVSHDRDVLDRLTTATIRIRSGAVQMIGASYSVAVDEWAAADDARREDLEAAMKELARAERKLASERERMRQQQSAFDKRMRGAAAKDHDLHSTARKKAFAAGAAAAGRGIARVSASRERAVDAVDSIRVERQVGGAVAFRGAQAPRRTLVRSTGPLVAGAVVLVDRIDVAIDRDTRLHVRGANGAGKTTLLRSLAARWDLPRDRLLYLEQEVGDRGGVELLSEITAMPADVRGRTLQLVARLGTDPEDLLTSAAPSPGETRKLALAKALATEAWCLILDEPTNHLDLPTVERLEAALVEYPGAMVVVTHDSRFASAVTTSVLDL